MLGVTYTPPAIWRFMVDWARAVRPARVVDPGAGSGRFSVAAGRRFPDAELVACELDPLAALLSRAHLAAAGLSERAAVHTCDYRRLSISRFEGRTLFIGNPPYVRHHAIERRWKQWLTERAARFGIRASQLAGLHAHFFLATALHARAGDAGVFVTAAEWLDVNYGELVRRLFLEHLGGLELHVLDPTLLAFPGAQTTAVIACFEVGARPSSLRMRRVAVPAALASAARGRRIARERFASSARWSSLGSPHRAMPSGFVELGELCRVHRGQATGANAIWIAGPHGAELPASVLFASITRARELFSAGGRLTSASGLRRVIDLPPELDALDVRERAIVERFLALARSRGADRGFIATHRARWWSVGLRAPAPILATYMARRPPAFVRNLASARHINVAHGIYPRQPLSEPVLDALAAHLARETSLRSGRTYAGGLTKFEPKEMERLWVPGPELLAQCARYSPGLTGGAPP